jgi:hypothetical protein
LLRSPWPRALRRAPFLFGESMTRVELRRLAYASEKRGADIKRFGVNVPWEIPGELAVLHLLIAKLAHILADSKDE